MVFATSVFGLIGCGQGTYRIPAVEPVVKPKPGSDDLLADISAGDDAKPASTESKPSGAPPPASDKAPEPKATEAPKPDAAKPAEPDKGAAKPAAKPADAKPAPAKPAAGKPNGKK